MSALGYFLPVALIALASVPLAAQYVAPPAAQRLVRTESPSMKTPPALQAVPTQQYSHGEPTAEEQYILELINRARMNPREEGARLATAGVDPAIKGAFDFFNVDTALIRASFAGYPSRPPLAFNAKLIAAARRHNADMVQNNFQGHQGTDGSTFDQRIREAGYTSYTGIGENVAGYARSLWYSHVGFNVDWGVQDLGHRHNIMNFATTDQVYTEFGTAVTIKTNPLGQGEIGPIIVVHEFARNSDAPFLLGVVYNDANSNGLYDVGEGLQGVKVMPSSGTYYAVTSASGGYAIPVKSAGSSFTVTFSEGPLASSYTRSVTVVNGENVKLDLAPTAAPGAVSIVRPTAGSLVPSDTVRFVWRRAGAGVDRYRLRVATDSLMTALVVNDSTITDTTVVRTGLLSGTRYFVQVQAHNSAGWGELAAPQAFRVLRAPSAPVLLLPTANGRVLRNDVRFFWTKPAGPVVAYAFELALDANMATIAVRDTAVTDTSYLVPSIDLGRYYWRVRAKNEAGWGAWSETRQIEGVTSSVESIGGAVIDRLEISQVYPNPMTSARRAVAHVRVPHATRLRLEIVDALGAVIDVAGATREVELAAGEHPIALECGELTQGLYFVRVIDADGASAVAPLKVVATTR